MENLSFDTIILGGGPAGLSAAIYAARGAVSTAIIDKNMFGGQPSNYLELENYQRKQSESSLLLKLIFIFTYLIINFMLYFKL